MICFSFFHLHSADLVAAHVIIALVREAIVALQHQSAQTRAHVALRALATTIHVTFQSHQDAALAAKAHAQNLWVLVPNRAVQAAIHALAMEMIKQTNFFHPTRKSHMLFQIMLTNNNHNNNWIDIFFSF